MLAIAIAFLVTTATAQEGSAPQGAASDEANADNPLASIGDKLQKNADGSIDVFFAPQAPKGMESNWLETIPGKSYCLGYRMYGPLEPWFDKTWRPGEIELIK